MLLFDKSLIRAFQTTVKTLSLGLMYVDPQLVKGNGHETQQGSLYPGRVFLFSFLALTVHKTQ